MGGDRAGHRSVGVDIAGHKEWWIEMGTVNRNGYSGHRAGHEGMDRAGHSRHKQS